MKFLSAAFFTISTFVLSTSCSNGTRTNVSAPVEFHLKFHASVGDLIPDVSCDTPLSDLGSSKVSGELLDLAFFVHGLEFIRADGSTVLAELSESEWQSQNVALLDFQNRSDSCAGELKPTNVSIQGRLADSEGITGVRFVIGMPSALNHIDPSTVKAPLNAANMFWSWQGGYKSMRVDISPEGGIARPGDPNFLGTNYFFHLGSTDCEGDPIAGETVNCQRRNNPEIRLSDFNLNTSEITLDLQQLVSGLDLSIDNADTPGCMSSTFDVECGMFFQNLGMNLESGASESTLTQKAFRLR